MKFRWVMKPWLKDDPQYAQWVFELIDTGNWDRCTQKLTECSCWLLDLWSKDYCGWKGWMDVSHRRPLCTPYRDQSPPSLSHQAKVSPCGTSQNYSLQYPPQTRFSPQEPHTPFSGLPQLPGVPGCPRAWEPYGSDLVTGQGTPKPAPAVSNFSLCFPTPEQCLGPSLQTNTHLVAAWGKHSQFLSGCALWQRGRRTHHPMAFRAASAKEKWWSKIISYVWRKSRSWCHYQGFERWGVVVPTKAPLDSPIGPVHMTDGSLRMTADYWKPNRVMAPIASAVPALVSLLSRLTYHVVHPIQIWQMHFSLYRFIRTTRLQGHYFYSFTSRM